MLVLKYDEQKWKNEKDEEKSSIPLMLFLKNMLVVKRLALQKKSILLWLSLKPKQNSAKKIMYLRKVSLLIVLPTRKIMQTISTRESLILQIEYTLVSKLTVTK